MADEVAHGSSTDVMPGNEEVYFISDRIKVGLLVHEAGQASQHERGRTWRGAAGPCHLTYARTRATQTFTGDYLWAVLIASIYEVFPLLCLLCGGQMRLVPHY